MMCHRPIREQEFCMKSNNGKYCPLLRYLRTVQVESLDLPTGDNMHQYQGDNSGILNEVVLNANSTFCN